MPAQECLWSLPSAAELWRWCLGQGDARTPTVAGDCPDDAGTGCQQVRIGIPERSLLTSAFMVYMVPLFFLLCGCVLGKWLANHWQVNEEAPEVVGALLGGGLGFLVARFGARRLTGGLYRPVMLGVNIPVQQAD